jgi:hypothetical protein
MVVGQALGSGKSEASGASSINSTFWIVLSPATKVEPQFMDSMVMLLDLLLCSEARFFEVPDILISNTIKQARILAPSS